MTHVQYLCWQSHWQISDTYICLQICFHKWSGSKWIGENVDYMYYFMFTLYLLTTHIWYVDTCEVTCTKCHKAMFQFHKSATGLLKDETSERQQTLSKVWIHKCFSRSSVQVNSRSWSRKCSDSSRGFNHSAISGLHIPLSLGSLGPNLGSPLLMANVILDLKLLKSWVMWAA